nr:uncharacterized protein LOC124816751 [Hydra vulgaris]
MLNYFISNEGVSSRTFTPLECFASQNEDTVKCENVELFLFNQAANSSTFTPSERTNKKQSYKQERRKKNPEIVPERKYHKWVLNEETQLIHHFQSYINENKMPDKKEILQFQKMIDVQYKTARTKLTNERTKILNNKNRRLKDLNMI